MRIAIFTAALLCGTALLASSSPAAAQEETELDLITVTINKVRQALSDAVGGVSVAGRAQGPASPALTPTSARDGSSGISNP